MKFLDEAKIYLESGTGGAGAVAFHREKYIEMGGPDGGNGGRGGHIYLEVVQNLNTLIDFRYTQHFRAGTGHHGQGSNCTGKDGKDLVVKVPVGTVVLDEDKETVLFDMVKDGEKVLFLKGGDGGFGNAHYKSSTNRAPRKSTPGWPGEERAVWLRLKLIADAGILGMPNAGKSTFLSVVSRAKPKIADYPFTTLAPNLGVVKAHSHEFVLADIPGLIEQGVCDIGIVGRNVLAEHHSIGMGGDIVELRGLDRARCRLAIAVPQAMACATAQDLHGLRIATSYPGLLGAWLAQQGVDARIVELSGSVEIAPRLGTADAVCDLVSSGATLMANQLSERFTLLDSEAVVAGARCAPADARGELLQLLLRRIDGVLRVRESKLVMLRADRALE